MDSTAADTGQAAVASQREAALREILNVISTSRDDTAPVFKILLTKARHLCGASNGAFVLGEEGGGPQVLAAEIGGSKETLERYRSGGFTMDPRQSLAARAIIEQRTLYYPDVATGAPYREGMEAARMHVEKEGIKTSLYVPLISNGKGIGCLNLLHKERRDYSDDDIALIETFAAHAVIAIENVRLFTELQTRLEREKATREILQVISRSRDDDRPVFEAILDSVSRLCDAPLVFLSMVDADGTCLRIPAHRGASARMAAVWDTMAEPLGTSGLVSVHAIRSRTVIHVPDLSDDPVFDMQDARRAELVEIEGVRSYLVVPLVKGDEAVGTINLYRREVQPFSDDEIALIETFAAQAVIAIENVRQFRELQFRLEREKASARILELISRSRDDDVPVFDAILESAARLCKSTMARLHLLEEGGQSRRLAAHWGENLRSLSIGETMPMDKGHPISRTILEGRVIHVEDLARTDLYAAGDELFHRLVEEEGLRTLLTVPLLRGGTSFGCIALSRREVRPFDERDIALVETFAAQAVIAIENVRQFRALEQSNADLVQALERQTATAEVLDVISQSQSELQPVLDKIAATAAQLCRAHSAGVWRVADGWLRIAAHTTADPGLTEHFRQNPIPLDGDLSAARAIREARPVHIADVRSDPAMSTDPRSMRSGARTIMMVPMISPDGEPIGAIVVSRQEPQPFDGAEIALVETFADQAAIAVENVRLFTELETRLEREAATREILEVISRSRDDETPVFDVILGNVLRLSNSSDALLYMIADDGVTLIPSAVHGGNDAAWQLLLAQPPTLADKESSYTQAIERQEAVQILDLKDTERYRRGSHVRRLGVDELGMRTVLQVPLISKGRSIGLISANRTEVRAYSPDEIELLRTFAAQAVIAIENVRQFRALEDRTEEVQVQAEELRGLNATLEARVEAQVGEIERMGKLKRFLPSAVADAIVSSGSEAVLKSHRALLGILFCDMRGFTAFCETAEPEETIEVLQTYHEEMGRLIAEHEAGVDHRMGDGIMVLFNDPLPCEDPAGDAVRLAIAMRARMEELCRRWKRLGHRLGFGVGISLGYATVGMVGYEGRSEYTASGTAVNLAARLCDQAEDGEILLSPRAFTAVEDDVVCEPAGVLDLKGLAAPVEVTKAVALR